MKDLYTFSNRVTGETITIEEESLPEALMFAHEESEDFRLVSHERK